MQLELDKDDCGAFSVDRDGKGEWGEAGQGFYLSISGFCIHFHREQDAVKIAKAILERMGEWPREAR